jgi:hypothetical protein
VRVGDRGNKETIVVTEENKAIVRRLFKKLSPEGYKDIVDELIVPSCIFHAPLFPDIVGPEGFKISSPEPSPLTLTPS